MVLFPAVRLGGACLAAIHAMAYCEHGHWPSKRFSGKIRVYQSRDERSLPVQLLLTEDGTGFCDPGT